MKPVPRLARDRAAIVLVDIQERLARAMPPESLARLEKYARALIEAGKTLGLPVLATEQYPKGLGPTLPSLREILPSPPIEKLSFSCGGDRAFQDALRSSGARQVILAGMETHVCVYLTARDLVASGLEVLVCADAVSSRTDEHRRVGLELCREAGATVTTAETAIFDLMGAAGTDEFRKISPLLR